MKFVSSSYEAPSIKVSVVVPIHNSEKYLRECLASLLPQSFTNIEVLCIDSSSTPLCQEIISEFQRTDSRIRYIKDPNSSYGHKINMGIQAACGEYISILETDDEMSPGMLEQLAALAGKYRADIIDSDFFTFFDTHQGKRIVNIGRKYPSPEAYDHFIEDGERFLKPVDSGIWTALYRREFLLGQRILLNESPGASYQDLSFLFLTSILAKTAYHLPVPLYQYRTDNAGSSVKDNKKVYEIIGECGFLEEELKKRSIQDRNIWMLYYYRKYCAYYDNYYRLNEKFRELFLAHYLDALRTDHEAGEISREMFDGEMYRKTFFLLDNLPEFKAIATEADHHKPIEAVCEILDRVEGRELVLFGAGALGAEVLGILRQNGNRILGICDNAVALHGTLLKEVEIRPVAETIKKYPDACYLIVNRRHSEEMKAQLQKEGIQEGNIEIFS